MSKNNSPVFYASIVVHHCEGNPQIFSGHSKSASRLFEWLYSQTQNYFNGYVYPVDSVIFTGESLTNATEVKTTLDLTNHFVK